MTDITQEQIAALDEVFDTQHEKTVTALEALAKSAEQADHWTDEERLMPATGVADTIYEALDQLRTVTAERDGWRTVAESNQAIAESWQARAEAAEAESDALSKACDEWAEVSQRNYQRAKAAEAERDRAMQACQQLAARAALNHTPPEGGT